MLIQVNGMSADVNPKLKCRPNAKSRNVTYLRMIQGSKHLFAAMRRNSLSLVLRKLKSSALPTLREWKKAFQLSYDGTDELS